MLFDDIFDKYKEASEKNEKMPKSTKVLLVIAIILLIISAVSWIFSKYKLAAIVLYAIALFLMYIIKKIVEKIDKSDIENRRFEQLKSFLAESHIYEKNAPLDFSCLDALIQDGEKILPRYKQIDFGEMIGVFSAFATGLLGAIFSFLNSSEKNSYGQIQEYCILILISYSAVAFFGIYANRILRDYINRRYDQIEKFINVLSDFKVKAIIKARTTHHKKENNTPDRYKRSFIYLTKTKSIHRGSHETRIKN